MEYSRGPTLNSARRLRDLRATGETHRQSALMFDLDTLRDCRIRSLGRHCGRSDRAQGHRSVGHRELHARRLTSRCS